MLDLLLGEPFSDSTTAVEFDTQRDESPGLNTAANSKATGYSKDDEVIESLKSSIFTLISLSGNKHGSSLEGLDLKSLAEMVSQLTQACEYKMGFLTKNYDFLEGIYDTTRKELSSTKQQLIDSKKQINHLISGKAVVKRSAAADDNEIIARQHCEIQDYRRFIKQMMERED